jgi:NitT/TauT family transport system permease protein
MAGSPSTQLPQPLQAVEQDEARPSGDVAAVIARRAVGLVKPLVLLAILVAIWQLIVELDVVPSFTLSPPTTVVAYIGGHMGNLLDSSVATLQVILLAFAIALVVGIVLGILINQFKLLEEALLPLLVITQVIPSVAIAPLLVLVLGLGNTPKIATAAIIAFFPILINTISGLRSLDEDMIDLSRVLVASPLQRLRWFTLPNALPYIFAGARVSITLSVIGAVVGEFVTSDKGLGFLVLQGSSTLTPALIFAALVFLGVIGVALFGLVRLVEYLVVPWARHEQER